MWARQSVWKIGNGHSCQRRIHDHEWVVRKQLRHWLHELNVTFVVAQRPFDKCAIAFRNNPEMRGEFFWLIRATIRIEISWRRNQIVGRIAKPMLDISRIRQWLAVGAYRQINPFLNQIDVAAGSDQPNLDFGV